jgi:putative oxidoreductase
MDLIQKAYSWKEVHRDSLIIAGLRVLLGIFLMVKGVLFISDTTALQNIISTSRIEFGSIVIAHYIALMHITGGVLIAMGTITRVAVLLQLPILIGAIVFNARNYVITIHSELLVSIGVLLLLIFFLFYGSGVYSADYMLRKYDNN